MDRLDEKLTTLFAGKVVRKDLTRPLKGQLNVPAYVLEYLLGKYCSSTDESVVQAGLQEVERILTENYVRPDSSEIMKSRIKTRTEGRLIDKIKVRLVETDDKYWAELANLQLDHININEELVDKYEKMLAGGVWAIVDLTYDSDITFRGLTRPFTVESIRPIQLAVSTSAEIREKRQEFTTDEWIDVLIRSVGFEPSKLSERMKTLTLLRLIPMIENNYNLVELGPRGTGKSYVYRELSPYAILISGGETTVPSLFVSHVGRGRPGLVSLWDVVAFDEVAGLTKLKQSEAVQILKDYMESGSFSRGREEHTAMASMVFIGNIQHDIPQLIRTSHLFTPFPPEMQDLAFLDRFHAYLPGWEIPKMRSELFTDHYGFVIDYLAEFLREFRQVTLATVVDENLSFGSALNERDRKAVRKTISGLLKLLHPDGKWEPSELERYAEIALEMRRRVKEQLKRMGGVEYWDTELSYSSSFDERARMVRVPEMTGGAAIPEAQIAPGTVYAVGWDSVVGRAVLFRLEAQLMKGQGRLRLTGGIGTRMREAATTAFDFMKSASQQLGVEGVMGGKDIHLQVVDLMRASEGRQIGVALLAAMVSVLSRESCAAGTTLTGDTSIQGTPMPLDNVAECVLLAKENGARSILLPAIAASEASAVPAAIQDEIEIKLYASAIDCIRMCLSGASQ